MVRSPRVVAKSTPTSKNQPTDMSTSATAATRQNATIVRRSSRLHSNSPQPVVTRGPISSTSGTKSPSTKAESRTDHTRTGHGQSGHSRRKTIERRQSVNGSPLSSSDSRGSSTSVLSNSALPRSSTKRRRELDNYDLVPVPSSAQHLNNEFTTPRALRALKRQRLNIQAPVAPLPPVPSLNGHGHDPQPPAFSQTKKQDCNSPTAPPNLADNDLCAVDSAAAEPSGNKEQPSAFGNDESGPGLFGIELSQTSVPESLPVPVNEEKTAAVCEVVAEVLSAESPSISAVGLPDPNTASGHPEIVSADRSTSPLPASNDAFSPGVSSAPLLQDENFHTASLQTPPPAPIDVDPIAPPAVPSTPPLIPSSEFNAVWAQVAENINLPIGPPALTLAQWRWAVDRAAWRASRGVRPKNLKGEPWNGTWKFEMMVRVEAVMEWCTQELVRVYTELQAAESDRPAPPFYNFSADNLPGDVVDLMDVVDGPAPDAPEDDSFYDWDSDEEDDDFEDVLDSSDVIMEVEGSHPAPASTERSSPSPNNDHVTNVEPNRSEPELPTAATSLPIRFRPLTPGLPSLFSFRTGPFEATACTPDGVPYLGRGTPVDARRRNDWATACPAPRHFPAPEESWFAPPAPPPPVLPGDAPPLAPEASFGVPTEVAPFCCTQDGLYGAAGSILPPNADFPMGEGSDSGSGSGAVDEFGYPAPQPWIDPSLRPPDDFAAFPPALAGDFPARDAATESLPLAPATASAPASATAPSGTTGCMYHSSLLECLTSGLGCVSGPFAGIPAPAPAPSASSPMPCNVEAINPPQGMSMGIGMDGGPYDVAGAVEPMPVQPSSALSHALG